MFLLGFEKPKKRDFGKSFCLNFTIFIFYYFPKIFFELLVSNPLVFSTLELKSTILSIGFLWEKRRLFVVVALNHQVARDCFVVVVGNHSVVNLTFVWLLGVVYSGDCNCLCDSEARIHLGMAGM